jgi:hypothetical protein
MSFDAIRDSIFKLGQDEPAALTAPGWPDGIFVRKLDAGEYEELDRAGASAKVTYGVPIPDNFQSMLLVRTLCDQTGTRLFSNGDVVKLAKLPQQIIGPAFQQAAALNGYATNAGEDAEKNSESGPVSVSFSTSPDTSAEPSKS